MGKIITNEGKEHEYEGLYLQVDLHTGPESLYTACRHINEHNKQTKKSAVMI